MLLYKSRLWLLVDAERLHQELHDVWFLLLRPGPQAHPSQLFLIRPACEEARFTLLLISPKTVRKAKS
ncbi:MAG: hypothetical protein K6E15_12380 [Prevotella sp.]|nr:hypothetical protein [Prevotella sp.]